MSFVPSLMACAQAWEDLEKSGLCDGAPLRICPVCGMKMHFDMMDRHVRACFEGSHPSRYFRNDVLQSSMNAEEYWIVRDSRLYSEPDGNGGWRVGWTYSISRGKEPSDCECVEEEELERKFRLVMSMERLRETVEDALRVAGMDNVEFGRMDGTVATVRFDIKSFIDRQSGRRPPIPARLPVVPGYRTDEIGPKRSPYGGFEVTGGFHSVGNSSGEAMK